MPLVQRSTSLFYFFGSRMDGNEYYGRKDTLSYGKTVCGKYDVTYNSVVELLCVIKE